MNSNKEKLLSVLENITNNISFKEQDEYSEEEKIRAAYALNMCMVSVSQIIDYDDLNILEQEYEGILNNLNLEMMPKDEALLNILKQLLDTITFFRIQEGDKRIVDQEYQQKMKNAIWDAVPNFGMIVAGGNLVTMGVSLASQVGIGYMNYRRSKAENALAHEKNLWQLQRSAMEQFNGLRRELFDTAWRLADTYKFPDSYRLTERQIKQYDDILMDPDEIRKYERLTTIKDKFIAYPPFWYQYGNTANHIARNTALQLSDSTRQEYKNNALQFFSMYWTANQYALLREDQMVSACALEQIDLLDVNKDQELIEELLKKAVKYSGNANDVLQLCAIAYLRIGKTEEAENLFRVLVNEKYNITINAQILSGLYVSKVLLCNDLCARSKYNTLETRVNKDYLIRMPEIDEVCCKEELQDEFNATQEELLIEKFDLVVRYYFKSFSIKLGKLIPVPNEKEDYPEYYYSEEGIKQRVNDVKELFSSKLKQKKRDEYLQHFSQSGFVTLYFEQLNYMFDDISELSCIRDRAKLQDIIKMKIAEYSSQINQLNERIENCKIDFNDMCQLLSFTSTGLFAEFLTELKDQIRITIIGMGDMTKYATTDGALRQFCIDHNIPEPDILLESGCDAKPDTGLVTTYFGLDLLGETGNQIQKKQEKYKRIESIIRLHLNEMNMISEKSAAYFHDSIGFNSYFESSSKLKSHKDILQQTIAVYDDKSSHNVDVLFTADGLVPIIKNKMKTPISYIALAGEDTKNKIINITKTVAKENAKKDFAVISLLISPRIAPLSLAGTVVTETRAISELLKHIQPMIDEICEVLLEESKL